MRSRWGIADPGGLGWIIFEVAANAGSALRSRRPVSRQTRASWRRLRDGSAPYPSTGLAAIPAGERRLKRLLTIGHSYVVAENRRLAHEMAVQGSGEWQVTAAAPARLQGDLRCIELEPISNEADSLVPIDLHFGSHPHMRMYGRKLRSLLQQSWDVVHGWEEPYVMASAQIRAVCSAA